MYTYAWFMLRFDRKQKNSVKQLSLKINIKKKKTRSGQDPEMAKTQIFASEEFQSGEGDRPIKG